MNVTPVIARELKAQARQGSTYWLRVLGAGLLVAGLGLGSWLLAELRFFKVEETGEILFWALNRLFLYAIWLAVPVLAADCLSREKREGTLGLLFLTPLRGLDIALAKSAIHGLRALAFWVAAVPVLAVPLLMGGVSAGDIVFSALANARALALALAAGVLASVWTRRANRAVLLALILSLSFAVLLHALEAFYTAQLGLSGPTGSFFGLPMGRRFPAQSGFGGTVARSGPMMEVWFEAGLTAVALLAAVLAVSMAAHYIERGWQERGRSTRQQWWLQTFCTPIFWQGLFRRRMRRMLERNPIGWLQQYAWSARLIKWSWCLGLIVLECFLLTTGYYGMVGAQNQLALVIPLGLVLSAAGSFRRERETGALELILVSPLRVGQIIGGRLQGIWGQFLPALLVLGLVWYAVDDAWWYRRAWGVPPTGWDRYRFPIQLLATYLALPVVGLYFSLRCRHYLVGVALSLAVGLWLPWLAAALAAWAGDGFDISLWGFRTAGRHGGWCMVTVGKLVIGFLGWMTLRRALERRAFGALQSAG